MSKARRDRQIDRTRQIEWGYYGLSLVAIMAALILRAPPALFWSLVALSMVAGFGVWALQYRAMDELSRLRFLKSWALSGLLTSTALGLLMLWSVFGLDPENGALPALPALSVYGVLVLSMLVASITNLYLRRQDDRA